MTGLGNYLEPVMDLDTLRRHLQVATDPDSAMSRLFAECWPRGSHDRCDRVAIELLRYWHPARETATLPECSCMSGRCAVCN
jgi:hypothetical protein